MVLRQPCYKVFRIDLIFPAQYPTLVGLFKIFPTVSKLTYRMLKAVLISDFREKTAFLFV
jgi:hypothetical protein